MVYGLEKAMTPKGLEGTFVDGAGVEPLCNSLDGAEPFGNPPYDI